MADSVKIKIDGDDSGFKDKLSGIAGIASTGLKAAVGAVAAVSGALLAGAGAAAKFGMEFEQSAAKASTLFGNVAVDTKNLNNKILELSSATGVAATELNEGLYSALSAGIPVTEDMGSATAFLEGSAKLAKAGFTDVDTAISATAKTLNAYGMDVSEADKIQGILIQTQNKGITTVDELGASLAQVTPTAAAFGVSFENVGAALATMTAQGTPTAQATTQLNSLIAELGKNGTMASKNLEKAAKGTKFAGKSFTEIMNSGASLNDVLSLMGGYAEENNLSMVDMFSSIEAGKSALAITSGDGAVFNDNLLVMADTAGVVDSAYETMAGTLQSQMGMMTESVKNLGISIFEENNSILAEAAQFANGLISQLSTAFNEDGLSGLVNALGDVAAQIIVKVAESAPAVIECAISLLQSFGSGISDNMSLIIDSAINIVMSLIDGIASMLPGIVQAAFDIVSSLSDGISSNISVVLNNIIDLLLNIIDTILNNIDGFIDSGIQLILALADGISNALPNILGKIPEITSKLVSAFIANAPKLIEAGIQIILKLAAGLIQSIPTLVSQIPTIISAIFNAFTSGIQIMQEVGRYITEGIWKGISGAKDWLLEKIKSFAKTITQGIKNFFGIQSPSKVMRDQVGKMLTAGIAVGIEDGKSEVEKAISAMNKELLESEQKYLDESERLKDSKEQSDKDYLDSLKDTSTKERKIYDALQKDIENQKKTIVNYYKDIFDSASDAIDNLEKKQDNFKKKINNFADIYVASKKKLTQDNATGYLLSKDSNVTYETYELEDLKEKNRQLQFYSDNLQKLKDRGATPALYDSIREMSIEDGSKAMYALLNATDEAFSEYIKDYEENQRLASELSKKAYEDDATELQKTLTEKFGETPEQFFGIGSDSAAQFGEGFMAQLSEVLQTAKQTINETMAGVTPVSVIANAGMNANAPSNYTDNSKVIINANGVTAHGIIEANKQYDITKKHTRGW